MATFFGRQRSGAVKTVPGSPSFFLLAATLASLLNGCTSEPLLSRQGVSSEAFSEITRQTLIGLSRVGEQEDVDGPTNYIGGFIPVKSYNPRMDDGIRAVVDGRKRSALPMVATIRKPGPHQIILEVPALEPFKLIFVDPVRLRTGQGEIEAWPPVILHKQTGGIFTTLNMSGVELDRNGRAESKKMAKKVGSDPLLIVTTTDKPDPAWRKIGQMRLHAETAAN